MHIGEHIGHGIAFLFADKLVPAVVKYADGDHIGVAQEVVQITQGFLVCAHKEDAKIVFLAIAQGVQFQGGLHALGVDKLVDTAIRIAGNVRNDGVARRKFLEPVYGHDREKLVNGPGIGQRLEHAEVAVIDIRQHGINRFKILGRVRHFALQPGDLLDDDTLALIEEAPAGLFQFEIGLQSMDETTLRRVRRGTDMAHLTRQVTRLIRCGKAHVHLDLIAGLPGEGLEAFARGFDAAFALRPHALQLGFLKLIHGSAMRREQDLFPCDFDPLPPYQVRSTPWLSEEDLAVLKTAERALDKLYNSGRFTRTLRFLTGEGGLEPFALFLALGTSITQAECAAAEGRLSLEALTNCVYYRLSELMPDSLPLLRDLMLQDRLATTSTSVFPACLKRKEPRLQAVKRALKSRFPRPEGVTRAIGFLYAGEEDRVVFCDYIKDGRHPVTNEYALQYVEARILNSEF